MKQKCILICLFLSMLFILFLVFPHNSYAGEYSIRVNNQQNVVTIYKNGNPIKAMLCSTGRATPSSGTYNLDNKYRWLSLVGGVYGQYCTRIVGSILFHSVPYFINGDGGSLEWWEYDKLGTSASAGCIRLQCIDAKWIYDNIPAGTPVTFYSDSNPGPLGKPDCINVSNMPDHYRCWDPTDPDNNNPWKTFKDVAFNASFYANKYPDLKAAFGTNEIKLRNHFYNNGIAEGRQGSAAVDIKYYVNVNPDLKKAFGNDWYKIYNHLIFTGIYEGRKTALGFDVKSYRNNYKDLDKAFGNNLIKYFEHYNNDGVKENRVAMTDTRTFKVLFDADYYAKENNDLKVAFGNNFEKLYNHFLNCGIYEGRIAQVTFSVTEYLKQNDDLEKAFGKKNYHDAFMHFLAYGINEERKTSPLFNVSIYKKNYPELASKLKSTKDYFINYIEEGLANNREAIKIIEKKDPEEEII